MFVHQILISFELFGFAFVCHINVTEKHTNFILKDTKSFQKFVSEPDFFHLLF